ncbi:MAG: TetR family transcriptional regulator [candidate division NC10 bacterium]|nr:TetR family transcriptional regulator [candidate division NC10 bacterium]MBI4390915.1 TetR family transcriptional regulator [candidate division NC10 bacterium]
MSLPAPAGRTRAPGPGRRARRRAETRARILRAALGLFARQGVFATTVEQITEAADVGKGTFFNYFPSKEHVLAGFGEMQLAKVQAAVAAPRAGEVPVRDALRRLMSALAEEPGRSPTLVRSLLVANLSREPVRQMMRRNLGRGRRLLARLLAYGQDRGEVRRDRDPAELARLFQQAFFGAILLWVLHPPSRLDGRLDATFDLFWSGIAARRTRA